MITLLKAFLLFILLIFISYRLGLIISKFTNIKNLLSIVLYGFVSLCALLELFYVPLVILHVNFKLVFYLTILIVLLAIVASFFVVKKNTEKNILSNNWLNFKKTDRSSIILSILCFFIILFQAITSSLLFNENADDAFYVSLINENLNSNSIYTDEPSLGYGSTIMESRYMVSCHELALSVESKLLNLPSAILCHTIIPFIMIIFAYIAYYNFANSLFNKKNSKIFVLLLSILFLFSGFTTRFRGLILLSRIWQGKEIFLNIILTLILANLINIDKTKINRKIALLTILSISGIFFTNTALFLIPLAYFPFLILFIIKYRSKNVLKLFVPLIPVIIYGIVFLLVAQGVQNSDVDTIKLTDIVKNYFGTGYYYILYIFSLIVIWLKGPEKAKYYFLGVPFIYLLTIYNPLFTNLIVKYFTGSEVFWRIFWLLPVEFSITYSFVLLLNFKNNKIYKAGIVISEITALILLGKFVYTHDNGFYKSENLYKIPQNIINETNYILDKQKQQDNNEYTAKIMAPPEPLHSATIRQYSTDVQLFWSRDHYMHIDFSPEEYEQMNKFYQLEIGAVPDSSINNFNNMRKNFNVNWIIINKTYANVITFLDSTNYISKKDFGAEIVYEY